MDDCEVEIRHEVVSDRPAIYEVHRLAFGRDDEAVLVDALRDGGYVRVSLVARDETGVIGHVLFSDLPIVTPAGTVAALALAPLAVVPARQRRGVGSWLVREGLNACKGAGGRIVVVLGHAGFYPRFGFSAARAVPLKSPFSGPEFMALELVPRALVGVKGDVCYAPPFGPGGDLLAQE